MNPSGGSARGIRGGRFSVHAPGFNTSVQMHRAAHPEENYRAKVDDIQREWAALERRAREIANGEPGHVATRSIISGLVSVSARMMLELDEAADIRIGRKLQDSAVGMSVVEAMWWCLHRVHGVEELRHALWYTVTSLHANATTLRERAWLRLSMIFLAIATGPAPPPRSPEGDE